MVSTRVRQGDGRVAGAAHAAAAAPERERRSQEARRLVSDLLGVEPTLRRMFLADLPGDDLVAVLAACQHELGTPYGLWQDDPAGFIEGPLGLTGWSKQRQVWAAVGDHQIVAVPSCFEVGKTLSAGALTAWWSCVWAPGTALTVTTATRFRQVQRQLWPAIRTIHARSGLPGVVDTTQWKMTTGDGVEQVVAYGFTAPDYDEEAVQGIHAPHLLIVIDEGGGIGRTIGNAFVGLVSDEETRLLVIGNPPTDDEASWFEGLTREDDTHVIAIDALDSPNFTGEVVGRCRMCPPGVAEHTISKHLVTRTWEERTRRLHGEDSPFYVAKARGRFPTGGASRALPASWLDAAVDSAQEGTDVDERPPIVADRSGQAYTYQPREGAWVRLGVDVAADGGDELAIARCEGDVARLVHASAGADNVHPMNVAGTVLAAIREAEQLRLRLGTSAPVRVKIDAIGVGWGVAGILEAWASEGVHTAQIVRVNVAERIETGREQDAATLKPRTKRDELWLAMRSLLAPDETGRQGLVLDIDDRTRAQLGSPKMGTRSDGTTFIESKESLRKRGLNSPDRGEALLLAVYEPFDLDKTHRRLIITGA